jgi:hypothetical protein
MAEADSTISRLAAAFQRDFARVTRLAMLAADCDRQKNI